METNSIEILSQQKTDLTKKEIQDANSCIALGLGVGALGVGGALVSAAVCPLCVVVAPGLIGAGVVKRLKVRKQLTSGL